VGGAPLQGDSDEGSEWEANGAARPRRAPRVGYGRPIHLAYLGCGKLRWRFRRCRGVCWLFVNGAWLHMPSLAGRLKASHLYTCRSRRSNRRAQEDSGDDGGNSPAADDMSVYSSTDVSSSVDEAASDDDDLGTYPIRSMRAGKNGGMQRLCCFVNRVCSQSCTVEGSTGARTGWHCACR
jgi:hypothetical protein